MSAASQNYEASERLRKLTLLDTGSVNRQEMAATDTHATIEKLLEAVFSLRSVPRFCKEDQLQLSVSPSPSPESREELGESLQAVT
jgi:hypothetical protein